MNTTVCHPRATSQVVTGWRFAISLRFVQDLMAALGPSKMLFSDHFEARLYVLILSGIGCTNNLFTLQEAFVIVSL